MIHARDSRGVPRVDLAIRGRGGGVLLDGRNDVALRDGVECAACWESKQDEEAQSLRGKNKCCEKKGKGI